MHRERALGYAAVLSVLLLAASSAAVAESNKTNEQARGTVHVTVVLTGKAALHDCNDPTKVKGYVPKGPLTEPWPVIQDARLPVPEGFLRVKVGAGEQYCVKDYAVETDQHINVTGDCGPVTAHRQAGTRNVGQDCNFGQKR